MYRTFYSNVVASRALWIVLCASVFATFLTPAATASPLQHDVDEGALPAHLQSSHVLAGLTLVGAVSLLDDTLYAAVHNSPTPTRTAFFSKTTHLGDGLVPTLVAAALWPFDPEAAGLVAASALRTGAATTMLKALITRPRPYEDPARCTTYRVGMSCVSMPSGHTAIAFSTAHALARQYPQNRLLFYGLAALAGWSRVETRHHWPSDVAAGALIGLWAAETTWQRRGR